MKIAIFTRQKSKYSETFIQASIDYLDEVTLVFYGGNFPEFYNDEQKVYPPSATLSKIKDSLLKKFSNKSHEALRSEALSKLLKAHKIDVALAHYAEGGASVIDGCEEAGVPLVVHCHGSDAHKKKTLKFWRTRHEAMAPKVSKVIAVSEKMKTALINLGFQSSKILLRPYGVNFDRFTPTNPAKNPPNFLSVGRFTDKKAPYLTVLAFKQVLAECPEATLTMAGDGELLETTRNLVEILGIETSVKFPGVLSHDAVAEEMQKARAFVQHSIEPRYGAYAGDSEGSPVAILEASACGLPIVATKHAGICESVLNGKTGFLVDERDVNSMAKYMTRVAQAPELAQELGRAARAHIEANYSMDQYINELSSILKSATK